MPYHLYLNYFQPVLGHWTINNRGRERFSQCMPVPKLTVDASLLSKHELTKWSDKVMAGYFSVETLGKHNCLLKFKRKLTGILMQCWGSASESPFCSVATRFCHLSCTYTLTDEQKWRLRRLATRNCLEHVATWNLHEITPFTTSYREHADCTCGCVICTLQFAWHMRSDGHMFMP